MLQKIGRFFRSNWAYIIYFAFYFYLAVVIVTSVVGSYKMGVLYTVIAYAVSVGLAFSPIAEVLVRFIEGAHPIQTQEDERYLMPLFEEVYEEALARSPHIAKNIKMYVSDEMYLNACAIGKRSIVVTRGAVESFSTQELQGILAHEFGHMANGDTRALMLQIVGNGFFTLFIFAFRTIAWLVHFFSEIVTGGNIVMTVLFFILRWVIDLYIFAFIFIGDVIIALNSRYSEYLADDFAYQVGLGYQLKNALYLLKKTAIPGKATLTERLKASHPHTGARIKRLESKLMDR